jgi:hypothetical protein
MHPGPPLSGQPVQAGPAFIGVTIGRAGPSQFIIIHERCRTAAEAVPGIGTKGPPSRRLTLQDRPPVTCDADIGLRVPPRHYKRSGRRMRYSRRSLTRLVSTNV